MPSAEDNAECRRLETKIKTFLGRKAMKKIVNIPLFSSENETNSAAKQVLDSFLHRHPLCRLTRVFIFTPLPRMTMNGQEQTPRLSRAKPTTVRPSSRCLDYIFPRCYENCYLANSHSITPMCSQLYKKKGRMKKKGNQEREASF